MEAIKDIFGRDIYPGHLIAIRRSGRGHELELSIALNFFERGIWRALEVVRVEGRKNGRIVYGWTYVTSGFNNDILIVDPSNTFLGLKNKKVKALFNLVDKMKDQEVLPSDYKIGKPIREEQEFSQTEKK